MTNFDNDLKYGKVAEQKFVYHYSSKFDKVEDVSNIYSYQCEGIDFKITNKNTSFTIDIKNSYKNDNRLFIEEYTDVNKDVKGWLYKAMDVIGFMSNTQIVFLKMKPFKKWYENNKDGYSLIKNKPSYRNGSTWQSAFRIVYLDDIPSECYKIEKL